MEYKILIAALLPVVLLLYYIYRKDSHQPEPPKQLLKAFFFGTLSIPLSLCMSIPIDILGISPSTITTYADSVLVSFCSAAIPEETAKLVLLWLLLRKNKYFDEKMDGIVYAVFVSLGFAAVENILYLFNDAESYLSIGITRGLFSIPGHFGFGILMGYYYSLAKFYPHTPKKNYALVLVAPVLVHGIYDTLLFSMQVNDAMTGLLTIMFLVFCHKLWKYGSMRIQEHLMRDRIGF